jgi:hypothetical protein
MFDHISIPVAKLNPQIMIIMPKTIPAIAPPLGRPKHSSLCRRSSSKSFYSNWAIVSTVSVHKIFGGARIAMHACANGVESCYELEGLSVQSR